MEPGVKSRNSKKDITCHSPKWLIPIYLDFWSLRKFGKFWGLLGNYIKKLYIIIIKLENAFLFPFNLAALKLLFWNITLFGFVLLNEHWFCDDRNWSALLWILWPYLIIGDWYNLFNIIIERRWCAEWRNWTRWPTHGLCYDLIRMQPF